MNYYVQQLVYPIFEILRQLQTLQQADASIERIEEILEMGSAIENQGTQVLQEPVTITFKNVNFAYFEDQQVLKGISFKLSPGEQLGLIGRTGSGKTTISRLLYRLYNMEDGEILLNGIRLQDYELSQLRRRIGLVSQDVQLFNTSLRNNITFFDSSIDDEKLYEIIESLNLKSWFDQLPKGFDTRISADDVSAGQAQLIALSRIFLEDPALVILDEASSRLDPATEKILSQALDKIMQDKTSIIIAHRLSTLNSVDKILELSYGEMLEYGNREELIQNPQSSYAKLVRTGEEVLFA
jgi:ABC-type multidrug transport system fused ATPase/permease subunit